MIFNRFKADFYYDKEFFGWVKIMKNDIETPCNLIQIVSFIYIRGVISNFFLINNSLYISYEYSILYI